MPTPLPTPVPPPQVPAVFVDESSQEVLDMQFVVQSAVPMAPAGFRWLVHYNPGFTLPDDWSPGQTPVIGDLWEGNIPASFAKPPVVDPATLPATADEAWAIVQVKKAEVIAAEVVFATVQGLTLPS